MKNGVKFGLLIVAILRTLGWLAVPAKHFLRR
jgi:hypothetical protein